METDENRQDEIWNKLYMEWAIADAQLDSAKDALDSAEDDYEAAEKRVEEAKEAMRKREQELGWK